MIRAALLYFAIVFGAGFIMGPIRLLWLVPRVGTRVAELLELPIILTISFLAARWILHRRSRPTRSFRLGMGATALFLMLAAEFGLVLRLRGMSISAYLADRDPVSGAAYYLALVLFAAMPLLTGK
jgi:hypothetical protein